MFQRKKKPVKKFEFILAPDVEKLTNKLVKKLELLHIDPKRIFYIRSTGSKTRAYARIWGLARVFQVAAGIPPTYVIEVLSQHFDKLAEDEKFKVLIHELMHIPRTFSGALKSHRGVHHRINSREVEKLFALLKKK